MLRPGEKCRLASKTFQLGSSEEGKANKLTFLGVDAHCNTEVNIHFQDIEGNKYTQTLRMGKDGYEYGFVRPHEM